MILKKKNVRRDIQHEFRVEFVLTYFGMLESALRRGEALDDLGYVIHATPSDMKKARETLEKHVSLIATRCGPCFRLEAVKNARPRINLFPVNGTLPQATIGCEHADFDQATINTLKNCFVDDTKEKDEFLDIIFAIISHAHRQPLETYAGIKTETVAIFFMKTILEETEADDVMNVIKQTMRIKVGKEGCGDEVASLKEKLAAANEMCEDQKKQLAKAKEEMTRIKEERDNGKERGGDEAAYLRKEIAATNEKCEDLKKQVARATKETMRIKRAHDDGKARGGDKVASLQKELAAANEKCEDQREHALCLSTQCIDLKNRVAHEVAEVEVWKSISKTSGEGHLRKEVAALKDRWDESKRDAENLRRVDAERKEHLDRVIGLYESLEKKAAEKERQAKQASDFLSTQRGWFKNSLDKKEKRIKA